jgi:hypothetical protein
MVAANLTKNQKDRIEGKRSLSIKFIAIDS